MMVVEDTMMMLEEIVEVEIVEVEIVVEKEVMEGEEAAEAAAGSRPTRAGSSSSSS